MKKNINIAKISEKPGFAYGYVTPDTIIHARIMKGEGRLQLIDSLFDYLLELDDKLAGSCDVRVESVRARDYKITNVDNDKQLTFLQNILAEFYDELIQIAIEGKLYGHLFRQIKYNQNQDGYIIPIELIDYKEIDLRVVDRKLELYQNYELFPTEDHRFLKELYPKSILNSICQYYVFRFFALNNWAAFTETYGKPFRLGRYSPGATQQDISLLKEAVEALGDDQAAVIPESTMIEFADHVQKTASKDLYESLAVFCENAVTKRILGQILTTEAVSTGGSYAQSKTHNQVRNDIIRGDIRDAERLIGRFLTTINNLNYPPLNITVDIDDTPPINLTERINIDTQLVYLGLEIDHDYFYETYKIPDPRKKKL